MMRPARAIGLAGGLAVFAVALHSWAIASTGTALGTDLGVAAVAPGELQVASGLALHATGLQPGEAGRHRRAAGAQHHGRSRAGAPARAAVEARARRVLELTAAHRGRRIVLGRAWSDVRITLGVRGSMSLPLSARLLRPAQGLIADVTLELEADPVLAR